MYTSAEAIARQTTPSSNPAWLHAATFDSATWWHAVDYSSLCDGKTSSSSSPASSGPATSHSEPTTIKKQDTFVEHRPLRDSANAHTLSDEAAQPVQTPNKLSEFDIFFNGEMVDPTLASGMLWNYVMDDSSDISAVAMPFESPYWKDLSQQGL